MRNLLRRLRTLDVERHLLNGWTDPDFEGSFSLFNISAVHERWVNRPDTIPPSLEVVQFHFAFLDFYFGITFSWDPS